MDGIKKDTFEEYIRQTEPSKRELGSCILKRYSESRTGFVKLRERVWILSPYADYPVITAFSRSGAEAAEQSIMPVHLLHALKVGYVLM